jgi:hypothetical protein
MYLSVEYGASFSQPDSRLLLLLAAGEAKTGSSRPLAPLHANNIYGVHQRS